MRRRTAPRRHDGHLAEAGDDRVAHAAFGVSQLDMSVPNVAGLALHPALLTAARASTEAAGVVDGRSIAAVFSWLRPNELVWNQWVNNYLMGNEPPQYDILAWNNDTTRLTGAVQRDFLSIAMDNKLAVPGGLTVLGTPVDLTRSPPTPTSSVPRPTTSCPGRGLPDDPAVRRRLHLRALGRWAHPAPGQPAGQPEGALPHRPGGRTGRRSLARGVDQGAGHLVVALGRVGAGAVGREASCPARRSAASATHRSRRRRAATYGNSEHSELSPRMSPKVK